MATKKFEISKSESVRLLIKTCFENKVTQHAQIACVLANCQHETLNFVYSEEINGRSQAKLLGYRGGIEYFGRGYIHLTHIDNYQKADDRLGLGGKLIRNLDYATNPKIAAKTAVIGMRDGWFTGLGLKRWIDGDKGWITGNGLSYYYARQIVNGDFKTTNTSEIAEEWSKKLPSVVNDIDGYSVLSVSLVDINESSVSGSLIEITVVEDSSFSQKYTTNKEGVIPYIYTPFNATLEFKIDNRSCDNKLVIDKKLKSITLVDSNCNFNSKTQPHKVDNDIDEQKSNESDENDITSNKPNETSSDANSEVNSVSFNIKLVEADTGKPLPNATYHLEYKNNIKPHKTDTSGIESGIKAEVNQSISVLLDDDDSKKQFIHSMAFPVTADLNGQTKVLKVPVVSFSIQFVNENNKVIPSYAFKTIYRNRESKIRKANSQGVSQFKALAGQKITIIDANGRAKTSGIVTDGTLKWIIRINSSVLEETKTSSGRPGLAKNEDSLDNDNPTTNNTPEANVNKPEIKEKDVNTPQGPTRVVESDVTHFTIKFLDESTNKPISGLTYYTKSTNYGKNPQVTGSDGTRGRPHESLIGVDIMVLVYEDGKEVEKGRFTVSHDRNEPYVYKAKKPSYSDVKIKFTTDRTSVVSAKTRGILRELASKNGMSQIVVTSTLRTPEEQARAMYNNISKGRIIRYREPGAEVTKICQEGLRKKLSKNQIIKNMVAKILEYDHKGQRVSLHCVSSNSYAKMNIIDLGINSNGFNSTSKQRKFQAVCEQAKKEGKISRILSPLTNKGEPAFHLEIPQ